MRNFILPALQTCIILLAITGVYILQTTGTVYELRAQSVTPEGEYYGYTEVNFPDLLATGDEDFQTIYFTLKNGPDGFAIVDKQAKRPFFGSLTGYYYDKKLTIRGAEDYFNQQMDAENLPVGTAGIIEVRIAPWGGYQFTKFTVQ